MLLFRVVARRVSCGLHGKRRRCCSDLAGCWIGFSLSDCVITVHCCCGKLCGCWELVTTRDFRLGCCRSGRRRSCGCWLSCGRSWSNWLSRHWLSGDRSRVGRCGHWLGCNWSRVGGNRRRGRGRSWCRSWVSSHGSDCGSGALSRLTSLWGRSSSVGLCTLCSWCRKDLCRGSCSGLQHSYSLHVSGHA